MPRFAIRERLDVFEPRRLIRSAAAELGFRHSCCLELAIVVSELVSNVLKYGVEGTIEFDKLVDQQCGVGARDPGHRYRATLPKSRARIAGRLRRPRANRSRVDATARWSRYWTRRRASAVGLVRRGVRDRRKDNHRQALRELACTRATAIAEVIRSTRDAKRHRAQAIAASPPSDSTRLTTSRRRCSCRRPSCGRARRCRARCERAAESAWPWP